MIISQMMKNRDEIDLTLQIDFPNLRLAFSGDEEHEFEASYSDLEEMNADYQERIAPYLLEEECHDTRLDQPIRPIADLENYYYDELDQQDSGTAPSSSLPALDQAVIEFANHLRRSVNKAIGGERESIDLNMVVFTRNDYGIAGVILNPEIASEFSDTELEEGTAKAKSLTQLYRDWFGDQHEPDTALKLEGHPLLEPLQQFQAPESQSPIDILSSCFDRFLYLACAHIEADPQLRDSVSSSEHFRVYSLKDDGEPIYFGYRRLALRFVNKPASEYFTASKHA